MSILFFTKKLPKSLFLLILGLLGAIQMVSANDDNFFDYLPKYRKFKSHYQIDQIEYQEKRTIVHFRFVAQETASVTLYNGTHPNAWYLRTPTRMRGLEIQFKQLDITEIAINNEIKRAALSTVPEISYKLNRGDVVTCQVHFVRIPNYIRMLDMIDGKDGELDENKHNCFDIMIKTKENQLLGTSDNMLAVVQRFEKSFTYITPKVARNEMIIASTNNQPSTNSLNPNTSTTSNLAAPTTTITTSKTVDKKETINIGHAPEPIDYMPVALSGIGELKCNTRVYLPNVVFDEDEVKFSGRVKAIQNIKVVAEYLHTYQNARVNLYGHTDIHGSLRKNLDLSRERAMAVKRELVAMGVDSEKISVYFFAGEQPLKKYPNGGTANRRVEVEPICVD